MLLASISILYNTVYTVVERGASNQSFHHHFNALLGNNSANLSPASDDNVYSITANEWAESVMIFDSSHS